MLETEPLICYACDTEFVVDTPYETDYSVSFCPFCGSEVEGEEEEFDEEEDDPFK
jgi:rRNA maturation endonuclease Nob1